MENQKLTMLVKGFDRKKLNYSMRFVS